jgi:GntR family transcriptional regulator
VSEQRLLYVQVQDNLAKLITSGEWQPDTKIPSERALSRQIGVSRVTIRQAIQELENIGLLYRVHGKGTFVARPRIEIDAHGLISFTNSMLQRGIHPSARVLDFSRIPASRKVAQALNVEVAHQLYRVYRLRFANNLPLAIELSFFRCDRCPNLEDVDLATASIRRLFEDNGIRLKRVYQILQAAIATKEEAKILEVEPGFPLMLIERRGYDTEGEAVEFSKDLFRGDCSRFTSDLEL